MTVLHPYAVQAQAWSTLGYGLFIHYGVNTYQRKAWGDGAFPASGFAPTALDCDQWARTAAEVGMRYAVLTAKHHDGFCLWPSSFTDYSVAGSPGRVDVVGAFVDACRRYGVLPGIYYSLWDMSCPFYQDDAAYAEYMRDQVTELLTGYGGVVEMWFDGGWDKEHPTKQWPYDPVWKERVDHDILQGSRWEWSRLYGLIHRLQPDCLVINNSSSDRPGQVRYMPVDVRTIEHFDFVHQEQLCEIYEGGKDSYGLCDVPLMPIEACTSLTPGWFWRGESFGHVPPEAVFGWHRRCQSLRGNLLLNVGPDPSGRLPSYHVDCLRAASGLIGSKD